MTPKEIMELAFAHLGSWGYTVKSMSSAVMFNRMSRRQQELFIWANAVEPEFFGVAEELPVQLGGVDLAALAADPTKLPVESLQVVRIFDPGSTNYLSGDRVRVVRANDTRDLPPRVTLRSGRLQQVATDLDGVTSLWLWYSPAPRPISVSGTGVVSLPEPFQDLLAIDLARYVLNRDLETTNSPAAAFLAKEESERLASFETHIRGNYKALESRFFQPDPRPRSEEPA